MTRVLVFGGRDYNNESRVYRVLDAAVKRLGLSYVIHGDATGADELAKLWAIDRGIGHREFKADWNDLTQPGARIRERPDGSRYDANAGPRRNQAMIDQGRPDLGIGFPGGKGTRDMLERCRRAGIQPYLIDWEG